MVIYWIKSLEAMRFSCFWMICNEHYWYLHPYWYTGVKILGTSLLVLIQFDVFHTFSNTLVILQYLQSTTWFTWGIHSLEWSDLPCKLHFHCLLFFFIYFFYDELSIIYFCVLSGAIHTFCFHLSFCLSFFRPFLFFLFYILSCWSSFTHSFIISMSFSVYLFLPSGLLFCFDTTDVYTQLTWYNYFLTKGNDSVVFVFLLFVYWLFCVSVLITVLDIVVH